MTPPRRTQSAGAHDEPREGADERPRQRELPRNRVLLPAVGWLLGPEMLANLRAIARQKARRGNPRTWMSAHLHKAYDEYNRRDGRLHPVARELAAAGPTGSGDGDFWFDYIADLGDSSDGTYATAYACQTDLQLELEPGRALPTCRPDAAQHGVHVQGTQDADRGRGNLPRGEFLFVGGDTAYHVADEITIRTRVARPFNWAYHDLREQRWASDPNKSVLAGSRTGIYGLPGNHDWYNDLQGFSLLFLGVRDPPVRLDGFQPRQWASYVAIQLPYGWQLWGLDIDQGIDDRQVSYFQSLAPVRDGGRRDPQRLILCTPSPPVVFHTVTAPPEHKEAIERLELTPAYECPPAGTSPAEDCRLPADSCRLDLSGDTHHYARYRWSGRGDDRGATNYTAVVSGLGGAFHHPSFTRLGKLPPVTQYPTEQASLDAVAPLLLRWQSLVSGSWIRAFPVIFGLLLGFGSVGQGGVGWLLSRLLSLFGVPGIAPTGEVATLWRSLLTFGDFVVSAVLAGLSYYYFRRSYDRRVELAKADSSPRWSDHASYLPCALFAICAAVALLGFHLVPDCALPLPTALLDLCCWIVLLAGPLGGMVLMWTVGAPFITGVRKLSLAALGVMHGIAQIATPLIFARLVQANLMVPIVWAMFAVWWLAVRNPRLPGRWPAMVISVAALAAAVIAQIAIHPASRTPFVVGLIVVVTWMLLPFSRKLFRQTIKDMVLMDVVFVVAWLGGIAALVWAARGDAASPCIAVFDPTCRALCQLVQFIAGAFMAVPLCLAYFAWYLAIAGLAGAHNNEVGGAAKVTEFRQIIRFRVHAGGLTGYVISVENKPGTELDSPSQRQGKNLQFRLIDVFTVAPSPPANDPPGAPPGRAAAVAP